jgi:uncharacterized integral membrane protein
MGEKQIFQPLTREDKITTVLYRAGIVLSTAIVAVLALLLATAGADPAKGSAEILGYCLYVSVGMSVFFIHLYIGSFKRLLRNLYIIGLLCLGILLYLGKGSLSGALMQVPYSPLLLLPLSGCLGFVTAKEAFCFKLFEGYLLSMIMPLYLLMVSSRFLAGQGALYGLGLIAVMLIVFTLRKVFMPLAFDIGDKSAYR